jgi:hypothetical protein
MVIGMSAMRCDWNVEVVTAKKLERSCQFHTLIMDETKIVLLGSLADPQSNGIENKFLSGGLPTE